MIEPEILVQNIPAHQECRMYAARVFKSAKGIANDNKLVCAATRVTVDKREISIPVPSHAALCLNVANRAHLRAQKLWKPEMIISNSTGFTVENDLPALYDLFEEIILNVVFSYTALEAFSNTVIPDGFVFTRLRDDKKCEETFKKVQIERHLSLDIKLSEVLPSITGKAFRKGSDLWTEYAKLRDRRNRIIHVKSADLGISLAGERNIWEELLKLRTIDSSVMAHKIIRQLLPDADESTPVSAARNNWAKLFPFSSRESKIGAK